MSFDAGADVVHRPRFDGHRQKGVDEHRPGSWPEYRGGVVGNQLCDTCQGVFSGIETTKSGSEDRGVQ